MNNPLAFLKKIGKKKNLTPDNVIKVAGEKITILPVSYDEILEVVFLLLPYIKMVRVIKDEHKSSLDPVIFFDIVENLIMQLNKKSLSRILVIFLKRDEVFVANLTNKDLVRLAPIIIRENGLIETMFLMRNLGAFE